MSSAQQLRAGVKQRVSVAEEVVVLCNYALAPVHV